MSQDSLRNLLVEAQILVPSYTHYGGLSGYQDYGIIGTRIKKNFLELWRKHFLVDRTEEVEIPDIVPYAVLKASGHVDKFTDPVVECNGVYHRADHLLKEEYRALGKNEGDVDTYDNARLETEINASANIRTALCLGQDVTVKVKYKSLMLGIGNGDEYLMRPEIAQTIYPNFRRYYDYHKGKLPFAIAQTGRSYRNEICPKPFERLRSFHQAEIEHFYDPKDPTHVSWSKVKGMTVPMLSSTKQLSGEVAGRPTTCCASEVAAHTTLEKALNNGEIKDQITATFIGKVAAFANEVGIKHYRFRQHLPTEMAHYAKDCWDLECLVDMDSTNKGTPGKWLECVGIANRGDYDLRVHDRNGLFLVKSGEPVDKEVLALNMGHIKKTYKALSGQIIVELQALDLSKITFPYTTASGVVLSNQVLQTNKTKEYETFYPHVIEPSFGVDRLIYVILSQNYWIRPNTASTVSTASTSTVSTSNTDQDDKGETREVISLNPRLAPYNVAVLQLSNNEKLLELTNEIAGKLREYGFQVLTDSSATSIGKRYVRTDRIGIPYVLTVDFESLTDKMVTIRSRDDMFQTRVPFSPSSVLCKIISQLLH